MEAAQAEVVITWSQRASGSAADEHETVEEKRAGE
jgi:hypothetical protein